MFKVIHRPTNSTPHPDTGHGANTPNPLDASMGGPGSTTPRGNPLPQATPAPSQRITPVLCMGCHPHTIANPAQHMLKKKTRTDVVANYLREFIQHNKEAK